VWSLGTPAAVPTPTHYSKFVWVAAERTACTTRRDGGQQVKEGDLIAEFTDLFGEKDGDCDARDRPVPLPVTSPALNKNDPLMAIGLTGA